MQVAFRLVQSKHAKVCVTKVAQKSDAYVRHQKFVRPTPYSSPCNFTSSCFLCYLQMSVLQDMSTVTIQVHAVFLSKAKSDKNDQL